MSSLLKQKKTVSKSTIKKSSKTKKTTIKKPKQPKVSQEQNALGNRAIEKREKTKAKTKTSAKAVKTVSLETKKNTQVATEKDSPTEGNALKTIESFAQASASALARLYPTMGGKIEQNLKQEKQKEHENAPILKATIGNNRERKPQQQVKLSKPKILNTDNILTQEKPKKLTPTLHKEQTKPPNNKASIQKIEALSSDNFSDFTKNIKTKDTHINTSAGEAPTVTLEGEESPHHTADRQMSQSSENMNKQKDASSYDIINHSGQRQVQTTKVNQAKTIILNEIKQEPLITAADKGMQEYLAIEIPHTAREGADALLQPTLEKSTQKLQQESQKASLQKEQSQQSKINESQKETEKLNQKADNEQESIVISRRSEIAKEQEKGLKDAQDGVTNFNTQATKQKGTVKNEVNVHVNKANKEAKSKLEEGEKEAIKIKHEKEKEAEKEKKALEKEEEDQGFWGRVGSVIKSAVKLVVEAIDVIFTAMRDLVKKAIEAATALAVSVINAARTWVVEKLEKFRTWAKEMVDTYLKEYFPKLAKKLNKAIDTVVDIAKKGVNAVANGLIKGVEALANALSKALDKILATFQTGLKAAVQIAGAVLSGDFKEALKIAIQAVCDVLGINSKILFDFFEKAGKNITNILKHPGKFFSNLISAVGGGIKGFKTRIIKHLKSGLFTWLTGAMSSVEIEFPDKFDFKGVLSLVMQIMGLTYENIKAKIIKRYPPSEKVFDGVEKAFGIIKEIAVSGPIVLWKKIQEKMSNLKETVFSSIKNFVAFTMVKEGVIWLLSLLNPASAIVKVLKLLFDFVMFLVERFSQIKDFVLSVYNSIAAIAAGSLGKATKAVEEAMSRSLPVIISLIARLAGLGGIGTTVQKLIKKAGTPVAKVVNALVDRAVAFAKKIFKSKGKKKKDKNKKGKIDKTLGKELKFSAGGEKHRLWIDNKAGKPQVMVASKVLSINEHIEIWKGKRDALKNKKKKSKEEKKRLRSAKSAIKAIEKIYKSTIKNAKEESLLIRAILKDKSVSEKEKKANTKAENKTIEKERKLQLKLEILFEIFEEKAGVRDDTEEIIKEALKQAIENATLKDKEKWEKLDKNKFIKYRRSNIKIHLEKYLKGKKEKEEVIKNIKNYFIESFSGKSKPTHNNFNPNAMSFVERNGVYKISYDSKTADGSKDSHFEIGIEFGEITKDLPDVNEKRMVRGESLISKPSKIGRGKWDSAKYGFDNAHLVGDQFGGAGKNYALNILPSSPNYNRIEMANIENKIADFFKSHLKKGLNSYNLTVVAFLSHDKKSPSILKNILAEEFNKDNIKNKHKNDFTREVKSKFIKKLQKEVEIDLKKLPAKFEKVKYESISVSNIQKQDICKNKDLKKENECKKNTKSTLTSKGFVITLGEDKDFEKLKDNFS